MKYYVILIAFLLVFAIIGVYGRDYTKNGKQFETVKYSSKGKPHQTGFTWKDNKGEVYPIYISPTGSCFVIRISNRTGKEYKQYLGKEISQEICKELGVEYKNNKK